MPVLISVRQERFCLFLSEGRTADEAYQLAGYKFDKGNPSHLMKKPAVKARIQELTDALARKAVVTAESLMQKAEDARARAMESGQISAAVSAIKEIGVLSGTRVERREVGSPGEFEHMADDELQRAIVERFIALGLDRRC